MAPENGNATSTAAGDASGASVLENAVHLACRLCGHTEDRPADAPTPTKTCPQCGGDPLVPADQVQHMIAPILCPHCGETIVPPFTEVPAVA